MKYPYVSRTKSKNSPKVKILNVLVHLPFTLLPHHSLCFFLSVWMAAARGRQYLEETRLRQIEGIRARTEERTVQLKLTELETRVEDLERSQREVERQTTARCLSFDSAYLSSSFLLFLFILFCYYVFTSSIRGPTLHQIDRK